MKATAITPLYAGTLSNTCTCEIPDDSVFHDCDGLCWDFAVEDFENCISHLMEQTEYWTVSGIALWNREVGCIFRSTNVLDIIEAMTVRSSWTMNWRVFEDRVEYSLAHHDAPTGSRSELRPATDEEIESA